MILADKPLCGLEALVGLQASALLIEVNEGPPGRVDLRHELQGNPMAVACLADAEVAVDACEKVLDFALPGASVELSDRLLCVVNRALVKHNVVLLDVRPDKLHALGIVLAVEFLGV